MSIMNFIRNNIKAYKAEWIKLKGTGIWWIIGIGSALVPVVSTAFSLTSSSGTSGTAPRAWQDIVGTGVGNFIFLYVLISILIVVRLCQTEHNSQGWKLIETQPIHRMHLYLGKFKMATTLSFLSLLLYVLLTMISAAVLAFVHGDKDFFTHPLPIGEIFLFVIRVWIATWGLMALQYFVSIWLTNFVGPFMIGFVLLVAAGITSALQMGEWNPYGSPGLSSQNFKPGIAGGWLMHNEILSMAWMLLWLWIGYQYYYYRSWKEAVVGWPQIFKIGTAAIVFAIAFYFIETPVVQLRHTRTMISGELNEYDSSITRVTLFSKESMDTVLDIPLEKGSFRGVYEGTPLKAGNYVVVAGNNGADLFMGDQDSINIRWGAKGMMGRGQATITGTRQAENAMNQSLRSQGFYMNAIHNYKPDVFADMVLGQWQDEMKRIERFKTPDNIRPSEDFISMKKKLATLSYLEKAKIDYPRMYAMYYPGIKLVYPKTLDTLLNAVSDQELKLLGNTEYLDYLEKELRYSGKLRELQYDSSYFDLVVNTNRPVEVRNAMLFHAMKGMISNYGDSVKRNDLFNKYIGFEKNPEMVSKLGKRLALENSLAKGMPAPLFESESLAGKKMNWADFKGKYLVIDVWATWCGPCREEDPFFQRYAEMYSNDKLAFVALSIDDGLEKFSWQMEAGNKSKLVVQLRAADKMAFMRTYGIESIPRYMLIDPEGRFVVTSMPRPSDRLFEDYLLRVKEGK